VIVCRVVGQAVATIKDEALRASKLLVVRPVNTSGDDLGEQSLIAVDTVGAGEGQVVLVAQGSSVRQVTRLTGPVDAAIVAILDSLTVDGRRAFDAHGG